MTVYMCYSIDITGLSANPKLEKAVISKESADSWKESYDKDNLYRSAYIIDLEVEE